MDSKVDLWEVEDLETFFKDKALTKKIDILMDYFIKEYDEDDLRTEMLMDIERDISRLKSERDFIKQDLSRYDGFFIFNDAELQALLNFGKGKKYSYSKVGRISTVNQVISRLKTAWSYLFTNPRFFRFLIKQIEDDFARSTVYKALKNIV